jgi:hypothetical protein
LDGGLAGVGQGADKIQSISTEKRLVHDRAVQVADGWAEYDQDSHHNDCYKKDDKRIFDQPLPFLTRQKDHGSTSFLCMCDP